MEIQRHIYTALDSWKDREDRRPLLIRGARQVGKSYAVRHWARNHFEKESFVELNFEERPQLKAIFERDLVISRILDELNLVLGKNLRTPGCLLFMDEIQACPSAITSLRYFYEKAPHLHVIAAGSLMEFILESASFPVGRIDSLHMFPLTFGEFIAASGKGNLKNHIETCKFDNPLVPMVHQELLDLLRQYYRVGGMPEAAARYLSTRDYSEASRIHGILLNGYEEDFAKYSKQVDWDALKTVYHRIPDLAGRTRLRYAEVDRVLRAEKVKRALSLLEKAGLITRVISTYARKLPLEAAAKSNFFKVIFLDIGLLQHALGFDWRNISVTQDLTDMREGIFAEQFVGQEVLAERARDANYTLHYWDRHVKGSDAEVDYVVEHEGMPAPVEVKSGSRGTLKSLAWYMRDYSPPSAFVLSQRNIEKLDSITFLPLYLASRI